MNNKTDRTIQKYHNQVKPKANVTFPTLTTEKCCAGFFLDEFCLLTIFSSLPIRQMTNDSCEE